MHQTRLCLLATLVGCVAGAPVRASEVSGYGTIDTNLSDPEFVSIETAYEDADLLDVRKIVQLSAEQIGAPSETKLLDYLGQAQFGRLRARSLAGRLVFAVPELSTGVDILMEFADGFSPIGVDLLPAGSLRLDVELDGVMERQDTTSGNATNARFGITLFDEAFSQFACLAFVEFTWSGDARTTANEGGCAGSPEASRFVPLPGEEPRFTQEPGGGWRFRARGYVDVPLDEAGFEGTQVGDPFHLIAGARATSGCATEPCRTYTDFHEVTVGNARIVDANGDPVIGASFDTESGWGYGAPPDPLPAPEAGGAAAGTAALALLGWLARSRSARAVPAGSDAGRGSAAISTV